MAALACLSSQCPVSPPRKCFFDTPKRTSYNSLAMNRAAASTNVTPSPTVPKNFLAPRIAQISKQIVAHFHPDKIILFGSQAYGTPAPESDIDLLVVMDYEGRHTMQAIKILQHLNTLAPIDLLVRTPAQVNERLRLGDRFMQEIMERGKVLYEANHAGMD